MPDDEILRTALWLAAQDIPVFPLRNDIRPKGVRGADVATCDPQRVERLHKHIGFDAIGVPLGRTSGLVAVRIGATEAGRSWWSVIRRSVPETRTHRLPDGSRELLFRRTRALGPKPIANGVSVHVDGWTAWPVSLADVVCDAPAAPWPERFSVERGAFWGAEAIRKKGITGGDLDAEFCKYVDLVVEIGGDRRVELRVVRDVLRLLIDAAVAAGMSEDDAKAAAERGLSPRYVRSGS